MADPNPFFLRISHPRQGAEKAVGGVNHAQLGVGPRAKRQGNRLALVRAKEAVVDEDANNS